MCCAQAGAWLVVARFGAGPALLWLVPLSPAEWALRAAVVVAFVALQLPPTIAAAFLMRPSPSPLNLTVMRPDPPFFQADPPRHPPTQPPFQFFLGLPDDVSRAQLRPFSVFESNHVMYPLYKILCEEL